MASIDVAEEIQKSGLIGGYPRMDASVTETCEEKGEGHHLGLQILVVFLSASHSSGETQRRKYPCVDLEDFSQAKEGSG